MRTKRLVPVFMLGVGLVLGLLALLQTARAAPATAAILYVAPDGDDGNPCDSSGNRCRTIQRAVDVASSGDEIRVAAGTYTGTRAVVIVQGEVYTYTQVVMITKTLTLRGGYAIRDWETSNPTTNPTVIDAGRQGRGFTILGDGSQAVVLDGLTITGGDYTGLGNPPDKGWLVCHEGAGSDCGGGLYAYLVALTIRNCTITDNIASRNPYSHGGGVYFFLVPNGSSGFRIENTSVVSNSAPGEYSQGGGLFIDTPWSPITITHSVVRNNYANYRGGGMEIWSGGPSAYIEETDFVANTAETAEGGGAYIYVAQNGERVHMDRVRFLGNRADNRAAALYLYGSGAYTPCIRLTNLVLGGNALTSTAASDALIYVEPAWNGDMDMSLGHVTAAGNHVPTFLYADGSDRVLAVTLANTLLVSFTNGLAATGSDRTRIQHTSTLADHVATLHLVAGGSPTFEATHALTGDAKLDANYRLLEGSAAIDQGVDAGVTHDMDGDTRPQGFAPDIGADEFMPVAPVSVSVSGPAEGVIRQSYAFTATVSPPTATLPITYTWSPEPASGQNTSVATYRWDVGGPQAITVTVENAGGRVTGTPVTITIWDKTYLPLVLRGA